MNHGHHAPHHWIAVAFAAAALALTISEAHGQSTALKASSPVDARDTIGKRDGGVARDQRSIVKKTKRAGKSVARQRKGVSTVNSAN